MRGGLSSGSLLDDGGHRGLLALAPLSEELGKFLDGKCLDHESGNPGCGLSFLRMLRTKTGLRHHRSALR